jgi:hypothetical protein
MKAGGDNLSRWHEFLSAEQEYERAFAIYEKMVLLRATPASICGPRIASQKSAMPR